MAICIDTTGIVYSVLIGLTNNVTGSLFLTTLILSFILIALALGLRIPIEASMILLLPIHIALLACFGSDWLPIAGTILIYLGILLGKNMFFR